MIKFSSATVVFFLGILVTTVAFGQQKTATLTPLCEGFYVHTTYWKDIPANGLVAETEKGVVLIDTGWDSVGTREVLDLIAERVKKPVVLCIISHAHIDRLGGIGVLRSRNIRVISTSYTATLAVKEKYETPEGVLPPDTMFRVDGLKVVCYYPGKGHAPDNMVFWFPGKKVLFGGCFIKSVDAKDLGNVADADLKEWPESLRRVEKRFADVGYVVPGHEGWGSTNSLEHTLQLLAK